uniref:Uncharacterized protein n=1 Tax=Octopus bimaculoides TaxID=37653 RepID=A0A0L8FXY6_OCTBM
MEKTNSLQSSKVLLVKSNSSGNILDYFCGTNSKANLCTPNFFFSSWLFSIVYEVS